LKALPIHASNPGPMTGAGNWTYLVDGPRPLLVDAGVGRAEHLSAIAAAAAGGPHQVLVTHAHPDHASGSEAIRQRWPGAQFAKHPWPERDRRFDVPWAQVAHGDRVETGDALLEVIHTPGHAPDHVALWHADSRTAFTGDLVVAGSTVVIPASGGGDLLDYLESLRRLLALAPLKLLPAHGSPVEEPEALIGQYLEHRQQREQQVLTALDEGHESVDAMVDTIYRGLTSALVPMARESVLAHLVKLERERRVARVNDRWQLVTAS
jgi:glyoxylase-like metal-dependent hydrolase (beta-lactamase superfamily II)